MRATWLTDLHLNFFNTLSKDELRSVPNPGDPSLVPFWESLQEAKPDVLFVTGDTAESGDVLEWLDILQTRAQVPLLYVLGNHDFYGSDTPSVREAANYKTRHTAPRSKSIYLSGSLRPIATKRAEGVSVLGIDGWGDARCGNLESRVRLNDWSSIGDFWSCHTGMHLVRSSLIDILRVKGESEAYELKCKLEDDRVDVCKRLYVLTHVPPFPEACWYEGKQSSPDFLPWFTCVRTGEVLKEFALSRPEVQITVLCGHTHGKGTFQPLPNLLVRTGGWDLGEPSYGNPIIQDTFEL